MWQLEWSGAHIANDFQSLNSFFSGDASGFYCGPAAWLAAEARVMIGRTESGPGRLTIGSGLGASSGGARSRCETVCLFR